MADVAALAESSKLLPKGPLASLWLNLEGLKAYPQAKEVFVLPRNDANLTVLFGGWLDVVGRSPYLTAGLYQQQDGFLTTLRLPRGREGQPEALSVHVPPGDQPGSRPLLQPKNVLFSTSYYLDVAQFHLQRSKLFNEQQVKLYEDFDKNSGRFLAGGQFSKLLTQAGPYQRFVAAHQTKRGYKTEPKQQIPAFALVVELREPEAFSKSMDAVLRGAALLAGTQFSLKLVEEKHGDLTVVGYRFAEDKPLKADVNDTRFNFSPCYVTVGNQFVASSTLELGHELIDLLKKEAEAKPKPSPAAVRTRAYGKGGAAFLRGIEDQLVAQTILDQAVAPDKAKEQVRALLDLLSRLGGASTEVYYGDKDFRFDVRLHLGK